MRYGMAEGVQWKDHFLGFFVNEVGKGLGRFRFHQSLWERTAMIDWGKIKFFDLILAWESFENA